MHWKSRVLTTRLPEKCLTLPFLNIGSGFKMYQFSQIELCFLKFPLLHVSRWGGLLGKFSLYSRSLERRLQPSCMWSVHLVAADSWLSALGWSISWARYMWLSLGGSWLWQGSLVIKVRDHKKRHVFPSVLVGFQPALHLPFLPACCVTSDSSLRRDGSICISHWFCFSGRALTEIEQIFIFLRSSYK